jgi:hypothetical protein
VPPQTFTIIARCFETAMHDAGLAPWLFNYPDPLRPPIPPAARQPIPPKQRRPTDLHLDRVLLPASSSSPTTRTTLPSQRLDHPGTLATHQISRPSTQRQHHHLLVRPRRSPPHSRTSLARPHDHQRP